MPRRLRFGGDSRDVFALVKTFMSDDVLQQAPLNVFPESLLPVTESFFNRLNTTQVVMTHSLEAGRQDELRQLADALDNDFPHLARGSGYLRFLSDPPDRPLAPYPHLSFVEAGPRDPRGAHMELGAAPRPPKPYKLQVVFHHNNRAV